MFHPVDEKFGHHYHDNVREDLEQMDNIPLVLAQISNKNYVKQPEQVEALPHIRTSDLKFTFEIVNFSTGINN